MKTIRVVRVILCLLGLFIRGLFGFCRILRVRWAFIGLWGFIRIMKDVRLFIGLLEFIRVIRIIKVGFMRLIRVY